ncbi:ferritin-like domain-containing protein [Myxococcus sp. Y35]|uniref:ferritin-like domain-containing protein n=1 Tax=Pseudomyxococcus flavus TaxID=3115648 RepID=UPI003CF7FE40
MAELLILVVLLGPVFLIAGLFFMFQERNSSGRRALGAVMALAGTVITGGIAWGLFALLSGNNSKGRVLRLRGRARVARRALGEGWADDAVPDVSGLTSWQRTVLGEVWMYSAGLEHASVPAFSKLSLKLSALGAPADLLEDCHLAALDEVRHARRCFALARAYSGVSWTAGTIPALTQASASPSPKSTGEPWSRLVRGSLLDGCLAEGMASMVAGEGAVRATDPVVRETLSVISEDEGRHAELAWDVIGFALERGGRSAKEALRQALSELESQQTPAIPRIPGVDEDFLARNGVLPQAELGRLMAVCIERTRARAEALLEPSALAARHGSIDIQGVPLAPALDVASEQAAPRG